MTPGAAPAADGAAGARLRFIQQGSDGGEPVLLLHGLTDTWFSFSRLLPFLPDSIRAIVPDQRGHGGSDCPDQPYTLDAFADDAERLLDRLGIERATVVGHSFGSFVARRMAARDPRRVAGLVLIGTGASARNDVIDSLRDAVETLSDPVDPAFAREFQLSTIHRPVPPAFIDRVVADSSLVRAHVWKGALAGMMAFDDADDADNADVPALVLGGACDTVFTPDEQLEAAIRLPRALYRIVSGAGHALHWEDPFTVASELMAFVQARRRPF